MKIYSNNIIDGYFNDKIGYRGNQFLKNKKPNRSFHIAWQDLPKGTNTLALTFIDHDSIPVCGFSWIHWIVANIDPNCKELPENASVDMALLEGVTSWNSWLLPEEYKLDKEDATGFGGCSPPDAPHLYTVELYAIDQTLELPRGFYMNELFKKMQGHILDKARLHAMYKTK